MKTRWSIFAVLVVFLVLLLKFNAEGVDTRQIDEVLKKAVLNSRDLEVIDNFIAEAVRELVGATDLTEIAKARTVILSRQSGQAQYAQQFSESAHRHILSALQGVSGLVPEDRRAIVTVNLLILVDGLADVRLADLAMGKLNDKSTVVRYWAVHCLTNSGFLKKLNLGSSGDLRLVRAIAEQLKAVLGGSKPEIIRLMVEFAGGLSIREADDLLLQIADVRIKKYADWTVEYELLDSIVLKALTNKILSSSVNKAAFAQRFGQLYSYAIQRYVKGRGILSEVQKHQLASVLVETEDKCISKLLGRTYTAIKRAVEKDDTTALLQEHSRLLGSETAAGQLPSRLNFSYVSGRRVPLSLPGSPQTSKP